MFGNNYITSVFILHTEGMGKIKTDSKIASYMVHVIWKICIRFFVFKRKFLKAATIVFIMFFIIMLCQNIVYEIFELIHVGH